ncbi:phosphoglycolate phosphatase [Persephonella hydrogeniphila]|uniref:phosphoglycolate phosphatase n=1 Tax=Persephonella hydrogeniphila TaxID=198703 RepID=A0A285N222_9AQUI|nr:HAD-IIIA family hydrolase [Persephonella hydrogeniphila]SNZ03489.1 phosphoglycolate phosphatase [Persephonella hydrogeniphila]
MDRQSNSKISGIQTEIETFLFDLDGTLIDSSKDIAIAVNYALKKLGRNPLPEEKIIKHVGYGGKKLIEGILGTEDEELVEEGVKLFSEYYFSNPADYTVLYPYAYELLKKLKESGKKTGIVTNKYEDISRQIIKKLEIEEYIDILVGGDTTPRKKPEPEPVLFAVERLYSKPDISVMIGDSEADIKAGKSAGLKTVLVSYGFGNKEIAMKYKPDFVIESLKEIL